ncbi:hypothetical protein D6D03_07198 [Aureobasidium pullulans]|nr:hypothetical protein D6D03_07198 [Aureobasidium pullulans]
MTLPTTGGVLARYPHLHDSYNDQKLSDIVLCFGDDKIYAHRIILKGVSGVFHTAFNSQLPVATQDTYQVEGYSGTTVHAMLQHIYGMTLTSKPTDIAAGGELDHLFDVYLIGNEYQISSLCEAAAERIVELMGPCTLDHPVGRRFLAEGETVRAIITKTAELYSFHELAYTSLLDAVIKALFPKFHSMDSLERLLEISALLEKPEKFSARLIRCFSRR